MIGQGACCFLFRHWMLPTHRLCITTHKSLFNYLTYKTQNRWRYVDTHFHNGAWSLLLSLLVWNTANTWFMIDCIRSPARLLMKQDQQSLTCRWLSCSGWGMECVSLVFRDNGSRFIRKGRWPAKVNILQLPVGYLNATINRKTRNAVQEIGTDGSSQSRQNMWIDGDGSGSGLPRSCGSGFRTVLEPNQPIVPVRTRTAGGLPGPVANTILLWTHLWTDKDIQCLGGVGREGMKTLLWYNLAWSRHDSPVFTIPADVATPQDKLFSIAGVVGSLPLICFANGKHNQRPTEQFGMGHSPWLWGSRQSL